MSVAQVLEIGRDLFYTALLLALPALAAGLIVSLLVSILQALTSIQEQTLSFAPRLAAVGLVVVLTLGWALQTAACFTLRMFHLASEVTR